MQQQQKLDVEMAQFVKVTSIDDLHHLYPNLQVDHIDGIQCMLQDDQITQYTDGQGQQVIATIEQAGMQLSQTIGNPTQIPPQHQQIVIHQPTQYIIQQMDTNDHHTIHYIQSQEPSKNKGELIEDQLIEQNIGSIRTNAPTESSPLQHYIVKSQSDNHFVSQIQPIIHQPIQIHQEIQAVDVGGNILVLQSPEKQDFVRSAGLQQKVILNQKEKPNSQIFQGQQPNSPEKIQNLENTSHLIQQQVNQNSQSSEGEKQQEKNYPRQQIIQQLQYYDKITVIEDPFQTKVGIGSAIKPNENLSRQYQAIQQAPLIQQQQFSPQKEVEQQSVNSVQQSQHLLIPQLSSTPQASRILHQRQRGEAETSAAPVLILQKLDGPLFIRQPQIKNCIQSSTGSSEKAIRSAVQFKAKPFDSNLGPNEKNNEFIRSAPQISQPIEIEQKIDVLGTRSQLNKFSSDKQQDGEIKVAIIEHTKNTSNIDQGNKSKMSSIVSHKSSQSKIKTTDQEITETISVNDNHRMEKFTANVQIQTQASPSVTSQSNQIHLQYHSISQNQVSVAGRQVDNSAKKFFKAQPLKRGQQIVPVGQGVQNQNSSPRMPNTEKGDFNKNLKSTCGVIKSPRISFSSGEINQKLPPRQGATQTVQPNSSNKETNLTSTENAEEATMLVILLNGEKKRIKIPCSQQNILLGQILQQAGITSPASISVEQNVEDCNSEQQIVKSNTPSNQTCTSKSPVVAQFIPNFIATPRGFFATLQQQRPRAPVPRLTQTSNLGIVRQRLQISTPRLSSSVSTQQVITSTGLSAEVLTLHPQLHQTLTPTSSSVKEELPRLMPGYMAICPFCGIQSVDFNKCVRCKRKLPENVKFQSICTSKKKKVEKADNQNIAGENKLETEEKQFDSPSTEAKEKIFLQLHDKKKPKVSVKKKKISDEPTEILILSSDDEEEEDKLKKTDSNKNSSFVFNKEPVYLNSQGSDIEMNNILKESSLSEDLMKNVQPGYFTTLQCRNIRIGSYKVQPKERVFVSTKGIRIIINSLKNENSVIMIPITNILKVLIHFGRQIPVIFIYPLPQVGAQIRSILGMDDKMGPYYDPASTEEESHKRITLLLDKITEDTKITLYKIFESDKLDELSEKEANEILLRAAPLDSRILSVNRPQENVRKIMVYPPPPEKGGITLNNQDYACLGEDQFLNDVIIDFYLKYLLLKVLSPEDRNRTHVFSTFFYKRLTTKAKTMRKNDPENDPKLSPAEKRHMRVKGWTKQVNLFEKDFIIVPINEHSHWFLAIICFPGLTGPVRFSDNKPIEIEETVPKKSTQTLQIGDTTITHIMKPDGSTGSLEMDSGSDRDEAEGDQDDLHPSSDDEESEATESESNSSTPPIQIPLLAPLSQGQSSIKDSKLKVLKKKPLKEPIKQPCILIFDSLAGASRVRVVATLRDYLKIEYKKKMGQDRNFTKDTIKGAVPKVPQQNNFTDCGLYVLQYVESFFQDPLHDFKLPLKYLQEWFPEEVVSKKRQKLARLIRTLMEEQGIKVEEIGLPVLTFTHETNATDCNCEDEDDEDEEEMNDENEEIFKNRVNISDLDNDDEDDMDLAEDEEMEEDDDELEIGNFQRRWIGRIRNSKNDAEHSMEHSNTQALLKNCSLVDYEASESEEEDCLSSPQTSLTLSRDQASSPGETVEETEYCIAARATMNNEKSVPLTELQDFESQISCTTIEKNFECKNNDCACSGKIYKVISNEEESSLENTDICNPPTMNLNCNEAVELGHFPSGFPKGNKSTVVAEISKKLVKEKTIIPNRKDEGESEDGSFVFKNNLDNSKLYITKNCDRSEESKKVCTTIIPIKNNSASKRTYQALKSIRIPKKSERTLAVPGKRQKTDET